MMAAGSPRCWASFADRSSCAERHRTIRIPVVNSSASTPPIRFYFLPLFAAHPRRREHVRNFCTVQSHFRRQTRARIRLRANPKDEGWCGSRSATRISSSRPLFDGRWLAGFGLPHPAILGHALPVSPEAEAAHGRFPYWVERPHASGRLRPRLASGRMRQAVDLREIRGSLDPAHANADPAPP